MNYPIRVGNLSLRCTEYTLWIKVRKELLLFACSSKYGNYNIDDSYLENLNRVYISVLILKENI